MNLIARDPVGFLGELLEKKAAEPWRPTEVAYVLKTVAREILPARGLAGRCEQLELFADWVVHDQINRSRAGAAALVRIAEAFPLHGSAPEYDEKWLEEVINDGVSFPRLRLELLGVCRRFGLAEGSFTSWEAWQRFAVALAYELSGREISISPTAGQVKAARAEMAKAAADPQLQPTGLRLVIDPENRKAYWQVAVPGASVLIQVLFGGFRPSDFPTPAGWVSPLAHLN